MDDFLVLITIVLLGSLYLVLDVILKRRESVKLAQIEALLKCKITRNDDGKFTLHVDAQNELFLDILEMCPHSVTQYRKRPIKIHIGSATVGGVTTGGIYTTGGNISTSSYRSEKMELRYKRCYGNSDPRPLISKIILSDTLAKKAKESKISSYLEGNTIQLIHKVQHSYYALFAMQNGYTTQALNQGEIEDATGYPDREKCESIIRWLCGK